MRPQPRAERRRVPRLHEHGAGACELAHQPFAAGHVADDAAARRALEHVVAVPRHQVPVVDDVFFAGLEVLRRVSSRICRRAGCGQG